MTKQDSWPSAWRTRAARLRDAGKAVDAFLDSITETLKSGEAVSFTGFGKFSTSQRKWRARANPRNPSQKVHIPAARVPKFTAGSSLKTSVRE